LKNDERKNLFEFYRTNATLAPITDEAKNIITKQLDSVITIKKPSSWQTIKLTYPIGALFFSLRSEPFMFRSESVFSNLELRYMEHLQGVWKITDFEVVKNLFGEEAFAERFYSDSQGRVDFKLIRGGKLIPVATVEKPLTLTYNFHTEQMNVKFFYMKMKAFEKDNVVTFLRV